MPAKIARLATRPPFWIPEVSVAVRSSRPSCSKAEKREYSWQIGSHPGNPGRFQFSAPEPRRTRVDRHEPSHRRLSILVDNGILNVALIRRGTAVAAMPQ